MAERKCAIANEIKTIISTDDYDEEDFVQLTDIIHLNNSHLKAPSEIFKTSETS